MESKKPHATLKKMPIVNYLENRARVACDTECFPNYWAIGFRDALTGKVVKLDRREDKELDRARVAKIIRGNRIFTFNGLHYDIPMILLAMTGATCEDLKRANDDIIVSGLKSWEFMDRYGLKVPEFLDHIDLMPIMPSAASRTSLKKYAGMMHSRTMKEFEHGWDEPLNEEQMQDCFDYLDNDLEVTCDAIVEMTPQSDIRAIISAELHVDVRSMSDAQIGEAIMRQRVEKRMGGKRLYKPDIVKGSFQYEAPAYIEFKTPEMQAMLSLLLRSKFVVKSDGYVQLPDIFGKKKSKNQEVVEDEDELEGGAQIIIGGNVYKMGIGGLHSQEKKISHYEDEDTVLCDNDVKGYYPNLILKSAREPANMRGHYQPVYKMIVVEREEAKARGDKPKAEQGKIASNGLFGKGGSPYSIVYDPRGMIQTTVTGQLSLLMLIEDFTLRGWRVVSANTDGIVTLVPKNERGMFRSVIWDWEAASGLTMEETFYRSIHSQSVNSYVAFKKDQNKDGTFNGKIEVKRKGKFAHSGRGIPAAFGLKKTPDVEISYDAATQSLLDGTPIESTVRNCQDIRKFVSVRNVKGGAEQDGEWIGKVVRYYYSVESSGPLRYVSNGNLVPKSDGAMPCMTLPDELPGDIDYEHYEIEAYAILHECGVDAADPTTRGRTGHYFGRLEDQKTYHFVKASTAIASCGAERKNRREPWLEFKAVPEGERYCAKCRRIETL